MAIVIPAFKDRFLKRTLESLAAQTDQRFKTYIGDDASPSDIRSIVNSVPNLRNVLYKRFETNLGSASLVRHWQRCINLSDEPWVWLFSDDDCLQPGCVAELLKEIETTRSTYALYRFNTLVIDGNDRPRKLNPPHPQNESWGQFAYFLFRQLRSSTAQEIVFSRTHFETKGFLDLPLAWGTDHANVLTLGAVSGIRTVCGSKVLFRQSGSNVSSRKDAGDVQKKITATIKFLEWFHAFAQSNPDPCFPLGMSAIVEASREWFFNHLAAFHRCLTPRQCCEVARFASGAWNDSALVNSIRVSRINCNAVLDNCRNLLRGARRKPYLNFH